MQPEPLQNWTARIVIDEAVLIGKPVIKGTRLAVEFIIDLLAHGWSEAEILENYPGIVIEDIRACLAYQQMPAEERRALLLAIAAQAAANREERIDHAEAQLQQICTDRELDWDAMSEAERENFVDDLIHEGRECNQ